MPDRGSSIARLAIRHVARRQLAILIARETVPLPDRHCHCPTGTLEHLFPALSDFQYTLKQRFRTHNGLGGKLEQLFPAPMGFQGMVELLYMEHPMVLEAANANFYRPF